jgi:hypothetical protein
MLMSSNGIVPPDFPDKMINDSVACSAMSRYLYAEDEVIQRDPDASGIGVRVAIYMQVILNNLKAKILWVGDYVSPWIGKQLERIIRRISAAVGRSKNRPLCTVRQLTFAWRFCVWIILMISIEGIISANGLKGQENTWSYGQIFPMIIVIIPGAAVWSIFYRHYPKWTSKVQSSKGRAWVSLSIVATFLAIFIPPAIPLLQSNAERIVLGLRGVLFLVPVFWRGFLAHRIRSQIGTAGNLAAPSSLWAIWTVNLEIGIDSHNGEE